MRSDDLTVGLRARATQTATLALGKTAPNAELLAVDERVLEAFVAHDAAAAHLFGFAGRSTAFGKEEIGINAKAVGFVLPTAFRAEFVLVWELHSCLPPCNSPTSTVAVRRVLTGRCPPTCGMPMKAVL